MAPGICLRLWTKARHHSLAPFHAPEIVDADLADLVLELALWGVSDPLQLRWIDPPRPGPFQQAQELLRSLGALNGSGCITTVGRLLAALPLQPRLGHMLLMAEGTENVALACDLAAMLTERDLIRRGSSQVTADLGTRLRMLEVWRVKGDDAILREGGDPVVCRRIDRVARQWLHLGNKTMSRKKKRDPYACGTLLVHAYPDRIARRRAQDRGRYLLASGRGALLPPADPLASHEYLVAPLLDGGRSEARIFLAEPLELTDLKKHHPHLFSESRHIQWDDAAARVVATRRLKLGEIVLEEQPLPDADAQEIRQTLLNGIRRMGPACLPWNRESRQIQARIHFLRTWQPQADWPDLRDEQLLADLSWLEPYLHGINKAEQLKHIDLQTVFESLLGRERQQQLIREAPGSITVPSGSKIRIEYRLDAPPVLAVRIQELFGLGRTPVLCGGKVALLLHLLSPAGRPIQITSDLAGFWHKSYPEIKKELKGRYPKHFWPDDPLSAKATRGIKRKP